MADIDEDFGDFTGFSADFPADESSSGNFQEDASNQGTLFAPFPDQQLDIAESETSSQTESKLKSTSSASRDRFANFENVSFNMADIDIPLPTSPLAANVHIAGGIQFDIPPLPDSCSFDEEFPSLNLSAEASFDLVFDASTAQPLSVSTRVLSENTPPIPPLKQDSDSVFTLQNSTEATAGNTDFSFGAFESSESGYEKDVTKPLPQVPFQDLKLQNSSNCETNSSGQISQSSEDKSKFEETVWKASFGDFETPSLNVVKGEDQLEINVFASSSSADVSGTNNLTDPDATEFEEFGTFESKSNEKSPDDEVSLATEDTSRPKMAGEEFGDFSTQLSATTSLNFTGFASFESNTVVTAESASTTVQPNGDEFGSLTVKEIPMAGTDDVFGEFGGFSDSRSTSHVPKMEPDLSKTSSTAFSKGNEFASGNTESSLISPPGGRFGDFEGVEVNSSPPWGDGGAFKPVETSDEFGDFASSDKPEFNATLNSGQEFGDFSTPSVPITSPASKQLPQGQDVCNFLSTCFPSNELPEDTPRKFRYFSTLLMPSGSQQDPRDNVWVSLQKSIDFTIPLYKWEKSGLQDMYYSALKIDPLLISRPSTLAILTGMTKFEDPLGGTTAAEDLMESFGFEGELEQHTRRSTSPSDRTGLGQSAEERSLAPTLLDLSLPEASKSPTEQNSFTLAEDLLGLDLNQQSQSERLTSIQELLRNERLVVNKSKWVDSKLDEFGDQGSERENNRNGGSSSRHSLLEEGKCQNSVEFQLLQLGLDANKVSTFTSDRKELSLGARSILGRLPDLSFMLPMDTLVQSAKYSI